jgi:hypothetical protein
MSDVQTPASAEGIATLRGDLLGDKGFRAGYLKTGAAGPEGAALDVVTKLEKGLPLAADDLAKLPNRVPVASAEAQKEHQSSWGASFAANMVSARSAAEMLAPLGFGPAEATALESTIGYGPVLNAFLAASQAGKDPKAVAGALVRQLLGDAKFSKAYRLGGGSSPEGKTVTALQKIIVGGRNA